MSGIPRVLALASVTLAFILPAALPGRAQASRTWVSGVGDDFNPCSRTAPCKTFAGAIGKTAAGGEISVLDPGGYGAVTITKSISLVADGDLGSVLSPGTLGIVINALPTDVVRIEGLEIEGGGSSFSPGLSGIRVLQADSVVIDRVRIHGHQHATYGFGIWVAPTASTTRVFVTDSTISHNKVGVRIEGASITARIHLDNVELVRNSVAGLQAVGSNAIAVIEGSTITQNQTGIAVTSGASVVSLGNNTLTANGTNGAPTSTISQQ